MGLNIILFHLEKFLSEALSSLTQQFEHLLHTKSELMLFFFNFLFLDRLGKFLVISAWVLSFIFSIPLLVIQKHIRLCDNSYQCWINLPNWQWKVSFNKNIILSCILKCNLKKTCRKKKTTNKQTKNTHHHHHHQQQQKQLQHMYKIFSIQNYS